VSEETDQQ
jgi:hypothetical protein